MKADLQSDRLVVYTVLMGQPAALNPVPGFPNVDFVCFTDQNLVRTDGWQVKLVEPAVPGDNPRSSRHPKVLPHLYLAKYSRSIYVDTSVLLVGDPELLWDQLVPTPDVVFGAIYHSFRYSMIDVIKAVSLHRFDDDRVLLKQLEIAEEEFPGYRSARPVWGGMLARRHNNPDVKTAMEHWFSHIARYSRRDQTSLPLALRKLRGDQVSLSHFDNHLSDFHVWPSGGYQKPDSYLSLNTSPMDWSDHEPTQLDSLLLDRNMLMAERDALITSRSWRLTRPLRALRQMLRKN
jgi:hypothetical protein